MTTTPTPPLLPQEPADKKRELDLREREVKAKEDEVQVKKTELGRNRWTNPLVLALFGATVGLIGNIWVEHANNKWAKSTEQFKAQSSLILEAIKTGDTDKACKNLLFFVKLRLVDDSPEGTIQHECASASQGPPSLPIGQFIDAMTVFPKIQTVSGTVVDVKNDSPIASARVAIENAVTKRMESGESVTDSDGHFTLSFLKPTPGHQIAVKVEMTGYEPFRVEIPSGEIPPLKIRLTKSH
jgi:hypothetical protein